MILIACFNFLDRVLYDGTVKHMAVVGGFDILAERYALDSAQCIKKTLQRIIRVWNDLPAEVVSSTSHAIFKNRLLAVDLSTVITVLPNALDSSFNYEKNYRNEALSQSGNKEVLVARLREALIDEGKNPDEFKFDGADEDNEISTGTFTTAKMMELLLSMSTEIKQIKEQSERQSERQTEDLKQIKEQSERQSERQTEELKQQIKEQSERQTEELKQIKDQLKHTVEVDHKIDKLKRELEQSKKMAMPLDPASGRTLKVPAFDGEMSWNVYKTQFEAAATSDCWNGKERATALILALRGSAAEVLQTIPAENHFNYEVLVSALDLRYGEEHMKQIYRSQLRNRTQRSGESIQQLAQDIERLTLLSYPTSDPEHRDETALDTFIKALRDSELKQSLLLSDKRKLKDAVAHSLTFESAKQASKSDVRLRQVHEECSCQKVIVKREPQQHGVPQCWICGEKGHLRRDCKHRLKDNYCRNCATRWRKIREDDPVSQSAPSNEGAEN
ncbi:hypothetical protein HELRODRAFT_184581 [Helobdella robusta]|uniref:CCHC-type domain-containing protein n=1 Tax=Helobdella robusta TaxID=6412 RepID=T1FLI8_HELRO|nr:hypothetical protein HELRODRAFT_184581 [Helobdella robusta]ESO09617.1 hypothetical protein HELRODRAFT_184581 [Helobdella robusta]